VGGWVDSKREGQAEEEGEGEGEGKGNGLGKEGGKGERGNGEGGRGGEVTRARVSEEKGRELQGLVCRNRGLQMFAEKNPRGRAGLRHCARARPH